MHTPLGGMEEREGWMDGRDRWRGGRDGGEGGEGREGGKGQYTLVIQGHIYRERA